MSFEERTKEFQKEVELLQKKLGVQMYAAIIVAKNGEVGPQIRLMNTFSDIVSLEKEQKTYENKPKAGNSINKKA